MGQFDPKRKTPWDEVGTDVIFSAGHQQLSLEGAQQSASVPVAASSFVEYGGDSVRCRVLDRCGERQGAATLGRPLKPLPLDGLLV